uniref:Uncharacterized protein n=1 Tax=Oryza barthii TaxID=65489 RepID=A0A0D3HQK1_9ORYZ
MAPRLCAWKAGRCMEERPMTRDGGGGSGSPWVDPAPPRRIWPEQAAPVRQRWETKVAASGDWAAGGSQRRRSACAEDTVATGGGDSAGPGWRCADPRLVVGSVEPAAGYGLDGCGLRCQRPCPAPSSLPYPPSSLRRSITVMSL